MENLLKRKAELLAELELIENQIKIEESKKVKTSPKARFFFKVGEKHPVFFRTKPTEIIEITKIDLDKNFVWVLHNGIEKKYLAEPVKNSDNKITTFAILVDKRTNNRVLANMLTV